METLGEQRQALLDDLSVETADVFYTTAILNRYINRAHKTIANLYPWQETQTAIKRSSIAGQEYVTYPENLRTDSVFYIRIDNEEYKLITFREYQRYKLDYPSSTDKKASDWQRKLFISPTPTVNGDGNIQVWGHEVPADLTADADKIIFAYQSVLEEAINMYAKGLALMKSGGTRYADGKTLLGDALTMAKNEWGTQQRRQAEYKTEGTDMFKHYDLLREHGTTRRGSFKTC